MAAVALGRNSQRIALLSLFVVSQPILVSQEGRAIVLFTTPDSRAGFWSSNAPATALAHTISFLLSHLFLGLVLGVLSVRISSSAR